MNIEKSFPCSKLTFEQRALTRQADHNWTKLQRFFIGAYINYTYPYKNHEGFVLDHLVVGANPILNYLLLQKLFSYAKSLHLKNRLQKPLKIGLLIPDIADYWGYQFMKHKDFWLRLNKAFYQSEDISQFTLKKESINDFNNFFNNPEVAEIYILNNHDYEPGFVFSNHFSPEYVIQLIDKQPLVDDYHWFHQEKLGILLKQQKRLAENIQNEFKEKFDNFSSINPSLKTLIYPNEKKTADKHHNPTPLHFLLTNVIWSTSFPYNWFPLEKFEVQQSNFDTIYSQNEYNYTNLTHPYSHTAFGSSKHTCNNFLGLEEQAIFDILDVLNCNIEQIVKEHQDIKHARTSVNGSN